MKTLGFIGMGNMGQAMMKGCLNVFKPEELVFTALLEKGLSGSQQKNRRKLCDGRCLLCRKCKISGVGN